MTAKSKTTPAALPFVPAMAIFGSDDRGKPHASVFSANDIELATHAAAMMRYVALPLATDEARQAAQGLPQGRVFASGRAFTPFCKKSVYEALAACSGGEIPPMPQPAEASAPNISSIPSNMGEITIGALLLAPETGEFTGWYEARVDELKPEGLAVLSWIGWPAFPKIVRRLDSLGYLPSVADPIGQAAEASATHTSAKGASDSALA